MGLAREANKITDTVAQVTESFIAQIDEMPVLSEMQIAAMIIAHESVAEYLRIDLERERQVGKHSLSGYDRVMSPDVAGAIREEIHDRLSQQLVSVSATDPSTIKGGFSDE